LKKALVFIWALLLFASLFSAQMYVVGEVFTATWCTFCPYARAALRTMAESGDYPYLIPIIWQQGPSSSVPNPPNPSPYFNERANLYSMQYLPHSQWCGGGASDAITGGSSGTLNQYIAKYNSKVNINSPIDVTMRLQINGDILSVTAFVAQETSMQNMSNTNIIFILTNNFDATQPGNYFVSVVRYHQQAFNTDTEQYTQDITLNPAWDLENLKVAVIVQNLGGNKVIYNAKMADVGTTPRPKNLISYVGPSVISLKWEQPASELVVQGFKVYRNGDPITSVITQQLYTDSTANPGESYAYQVLTVYEGGEESRLSSECLTTLLDDGLYQMGSGTATNASNAAGPININARSLHGQFIYTAEELNLAGFTSPSYITSIGFYVQQMPTFQLPQFVLRMRHTTATDVSVNIGEPWEVFQLLPNYRPPAGDWDLLHLDSPFEWDGIRNIVIDTAFSLVQASSSTGQVRVIPTTNTEGYRYVTSSSANQTNNPTTTLASYKPQIRFTAVPSDIIFPPLNLTYTIGDGNITLSWEPPTLLLDGFQGYRLYKNNVAIQPLVPFESYTDTDVAEEAEYSYYVVVVYEDDVESSASNTVVVRYISDYDITQKPTTTQLGSNFPNPFNPSTTIYFDLHKAAYASLEIFNAKGQLVNTLFTGYADAGRQFVNWNGLDANGQSVSSGIYLYKLQTEGYAETKKMILLK